MTQGWLAAYSVIENVTNVELCINSFFLSIFFFFFFYMQLSLRPGDPCGLCCILLLQVQGPFQSPLDEAIIV